MSANTAPTHSVDFAIVHVGELLCGLEIKSVQEIRKINGATPVHGAPSYVRGIINLRGQIVTVIDLRSRFGMTEREFDRTMRIVVVSCHDEKIGLLVDVVDDIISVTAADILGPPPHLSGCRGFFLKGVIRTEDELVSVLSVEEITSVDKESSQMSDEAETMGQEVY